MALSRRVVAIVAATAVLPFRLLFGPCIAWALAWLALRSQPAPAAAAP
jgi:hypothetical protein